MRSQVVRNFRLKESAYASLVGKRLLPSRRPLLNHLENLAYSSSLDPEGRSTADFSAFISRRPVSKGFAEGVIDFLLAEKQHQIRCEMIGLGFPMNSVNTLFEALFEQVQSIPKSYVQPSKANDPAVGNGFAAIAGAVVHTIYGLGRPAKLKDSEANFLDENTGVDDFLRLMNIEVGYSESGKRETLSLEEAYMRGVQFFNVDAQVRTAIPILLAANPNCVRYALSEAGERCGASIAYPITDAAYEATLRGERRLYEHTADEVTARGNNIVLAALAENHELVTKLTTSQIRKQMIGSLLLQIALLLDTDNVRPIRAVSYEIISSNTRRLRSMGYEKVSSYEHPGGPSVNVVVFDPSKRAYITRCLMLILDNFVWHIRRSLDGNC